MTPDEVRSFLSEGTRTIMLATTRADGRPHLAPVWFLLDGDDIVFTTWHRSVKTANLRHDPRVALSLDDPHPPYRFVSIEGVASIDEHAPDLREWATRIAARYVGEEEVDAYGQRNSVEGEWLVRVTPSRLTSESNVIG